MRISIYYARPPPFLSSQFLGLSPVAKVKTIHKLIARLLQVMRDPNILVAFAKLCSLVLSHLIFLFPHSISRKPRGFGLSTQKRLISYPPTHLSNPTSASIRNNSPPPPKTLLKRADLKVVLCSLLFWFFSLGFFQSQALFFASSDRNTFGSR